MFKVILADDNADAVDTLAALLRLELSPQAEIVVVYDGGAALEAALDPVPPSVLVLDIDMPRLTGVEVAARLRRATTGAELAALVAITGDDSRVLRALDSRLFQMVLRKPIDLGRLLPFVACLERHYGARRR